MGAGSDRLAASVEREHGWLLDRLRSLDHCLDTIFYHGEVCSDLRGFGGLLRRCQELRDMLAHHIPEEEEVFERLEARRELRPLLASLVAEHRSLMQALDECLKTLQALQDGDVLPENLFTLQDRLRLLSATLQRHIITDNEKVFARLAA